MYKIIIISLLYFFFQTSAQSYLGPGIAGGVLAATIGIVFAIFAAIFGIIWFPLKKFFKNRNKNKNKKNKDIE